MTKLEEPKLPCMMRPAKQVVEAARESRERHKRKLARLKQELEKARGGLVKARGEERRKVLETMRTLAREVEETTAVLRWLEQVDERAGRLEGLDGYVPLTINQAAILDAKDMV